MSRRIDYASLFTLRKDGRYQGYVRDADGRRRAVYDRDPERLWHKVHDPRPEELRTFRSVAEAWEREHRDQIEARTWKNYEPHFRDMLDEHGSRPFADVSAMDVSADLLRAKAAGYSATVVRTRRSLYRMIFDYAVVHGITQYNPVTSVKLPRGLPHGKRTAPTQEEMRIICRSVDRPFGLFAFLLLCTGLRKSEALALQWSDVDFAAREIRVTKSIDYLDGADPKYKAPKTEAGIRTVPILDILAEPLEAARGASASPYIFPNPASTRGGRGGGLMTERAYEGAWDRYCQAAGLYADGRPTLTAHQLRHGTATLMFELGVDELTAQKILGHSRIEITREIYTDLRRDQKLRSVAKLNAGLSDLMSATD